MKGFDAKTTRLLGALHRAWDLIQAGQAAEAVGLCREVLGEAARLGLGSGYALWTMACACDGAGELELAFDYIRRAIAADPLALPLRQSFDVLVGRIRKALADPSRPAADESTPRLYELVARAGQADAASHLVMVRWLSATGSATEARALVDAVTRLFPASRDAWEEKARVLAAAGDEAGAAAARLEAAALGVADPPFGLPGAAAA